MKQIVVLVISLLLALVCSPITVSAENLDSEEKEIIIDRDINSAWKYSILSIKNNKATCKSDYHDYNPNNIYSIKVEQVLQKKVSTNVYSDVPNSSYEETAYYTDSISVTSYVNNLSSGTYRLKTKFTVTLTNNETETVTVYSVDKTT